MSVPTTAPVQKAVRDSLIAFMAADASSSTKCKRQRDCPARWTTADGRCFDPAAAEAMLANWGL
jgi:hypothetical protein